MFTKEGLQKAEDLVEREVFLPTLGDSVRIKTLPGAVSNDAQQQAAEVATVRGEQVIRVNGRKWDGLKVLHGMVEPKFDTLEEVIELQEHLGPAWHVLVKAIDDISGIDAEAIAKTNTQFQSGEPGETVPESPLNGAAAGDGRPDIQARIGA